MHGHEKSELRQVAKEPPNKAGKLAAEAVEPRAGTKGNMGQHSTRRTQIRETGFYNWFTDKARRAGVPKGRSPLGLRKASCRRLAEAGCSPHEIMSVSGHVTQSREPGAARQQRHCGTPDGAEGGRRIGKPDSELANPLLLLAKVPSNSLF